MKEYNEETHVVLSKETFNQFKGYAQIIVELKAHGVEIEKAAETLTTYKDLLAKYKVSYELIVYCVMRMTSVFGLNTPDGKMIRAGILSGEENPMRGVLKELGSLMTTAMMAESNPNGDAAKKMKDKFAFFNYLSYLIEFYNNQKAVKIKIPADYLTHLPEAVKTELA